MSDALRHLLRTSSRADPRRRFTSPSRQGTTKSGALDRTVDWTDTRFHRGPEFQLSAKWCLHPGTPFLAFGMEELLAVAYSSIPPTSTSIPGVWETGLGAVSVTQSPEDPRYNIKMEGSFQNMRVVAPLLPPADWIVHLQISIPLYCVGRVIGKQGAGMVRMRRTTGMVDVRGFYPLENCKDRKSLFLMGAFQALTDVLAWLADMIETSSPAKARATTSLMEVVQLNKPLVFVPLMKFDYTLQQ